MAARQGSDGGSQGTARISLAAVYRWRVASLAGASVFDRLENKGNRNALSAGTAPPHAGNECPELISIFTFTWIGLDRIGMERTFYRHRRWIAVWFSSWLAAVCLFAPICRADTGRKEIRTARLINAVVHRLERLQNIVVRYKEGVYRPKGTFPLVLAKRLHAIPIYGHRYYRCRFRFLRGRSFYERSLTPISLAAVGTPGGPLPATHVKSLESLMPSRTETLDYTYNSPHRPVGAIMNVGERRPPYSAIDVALGLRVPGAERWISPTDVRRMMVGHVNGSTTTTWEQSADGDVLRWSWFSDKGKVELQQFEVMGPRRGAVYDRRLCSKFHDFQGLLLPGRVEETDWAPNGTHTLVYHAVLTNIKYRIGAKSNTAKSYYIVFPKGAGVLDERINQQFNVESGPRRLTDKAIFKLQEHYDAIPGQEMLPNANTANPALSPPALPIGSSAVPATGASRGGMPRWLWEVIAALALGGLAVVIWMGVKTLRGGGK